MSELHEKNIPAQQVISRTHEGAYADIGDIYRALHRWARDNNVRTTGNGLTIFHTPANAFDPSSARFEVCLPAPDAKAGEAPVQVKTLPSARVAFIEYRGPYSEIPARYTETLAWINAQGYEVVGPPREVYIKRPATPGTDSADCVTEIQFPVRA